ncbi:MAG: XRE family transcriptional regulator [Puniceicoccaceae bacterium]|nr:MAG: XRE family transcriptional regulator [Puniceicoccaceae bacterium]
MVIYVELIDIVAVRTRELRVHFGLTQQELAELADVSEQSIQKLESRSKKQIWLQTVEQLAEAFGLGAHEFLAPDLPVDKAKLSKRVPSSRVHRK